MARFAKPTAAPRRPDPTRSVDLNAIHDLLRDRICLRTYPPGSLLRESRLGAEFGISRTPVREVLQRLSTLGLVEVLNGVGTRVRTHTPAEVFDIYQLRLRVAAMMGEISPKPVRPEQIEAVRRLLAQARELRTRRRITDYWRINHALHFVIGELTGNQALRDLWDRLYFQAAATWYGCTENSLEAVAEALAEELRDVLRAMTEGDVAAVGYVQRNCIAAGLRRLQAWGAAAGPDDRVAAQPAPTGEGD